jgi:glutamine synthetase
MIESTAHDRGTARGGQLGSREAIASAIESGELREVEVLFADQQGHPRGKRIPARYFLDKADGQGFAFCDVALAWDVLGDVKDGMRLTSWDTGMPDMFAKPDLSSCRWVPWREGTGLVCSDLVDHHGELIRTAPRTVLRRAIERLERLGYTASVGIELEFHLLDADGGSLVDGIQAYSLERANALEPAFGRMLSGLDGFADVEAGNVEYGPGQCEFNLHHCEPLAAADQASRFRYGIREVARRAGAQVTFMAKPFNVMAGNSMHLHVSLWHDGEPVFAIEDGAENERMRHAAAGILKHLPGITLYGGPTVNSYKRFEAGSFAPTTAGWSVDNRTGALRSLHEGPTSTRLELRTGGADAQPHWAVASLLAAVALGVEAGEEPPAQGTGNLYGVGEPLPLTLERAIEAANADRDVAGVLGEDAVHDYAALASAEWQAFVTAVTEWDRERYLLI